MERSNTQPYDDEVEYKEFESLSLGLQKDPDIKLVPIENNLIEVCRELHDKINDHNINDLRKHFRSSGMKYEVMELHNYYRKHIKDLPNDSIVKQEIDTVLSWLNIPFHNLIFDEFKV